MDTREIPKNNEISKNSEKSAIFQNLEFSSQSFERKKISLTPHLKQKMNHDVEMDIERIEFCQELLQEIIQQAVGKLFLVINERTKVLIPWDRWKVR